ncbi:hypothetical protein SASC598O02_001580, partial [Snodgrassella alvi SCGC AB-598-O02]
MIRLNLNRMKFLFIRDNLLVIV